MPFPPEIPRGDPPAVWTVPIDFRPFDEASTRLRTRLKEDSDLASRVLLALRRPEWAAQQMDSLYKEELEKTLAEAVVDSLEVKLFARQLAAWAITQETLDTDWGFVRRRFEIQISLKLDEPSPQ